MSGAGCDHVGMNAWEPTAFACMRALLTGHADSDAPLDSEPLNTLDSDAVVIQIPRPLVAM